MYEENNSLNWALILPLVFGFFTALFTGWTVFNQKKKMKEDKPKILFINFDKETNKINILVVNNKPSNITLEEIKYKTKRLQKYKDAIWEHPKKAEYSESISGIDIGNRKFKTPGKILSGYKSIGYIKDQQEIKFEIPNFDHTATYKILVKTSGGDCSRIYTSTQD